MEDRLKLLEVINNNTTISQKKIADLIGISTGKVNYLIQDLFINGFVHSQKHGRNMSYFLTEKGLDLLQEGIESFKEKKLNIHQAKVEKEVKLAVILAAGHRKDFDKPAGLLELDGKQVIRRNIEILQDNGINQFVIVTGYRKEAFQEFRLLPNIQFVENRKYKWTGSMASLAVARQYINDDFLLIEDDIVIEESAVKRLINNPQRDCILITNESGSGDEAFVEIRNGFLYKLSKDIHHFNRIDGEMIGVSKFSLDVFEKMVDAYEHYNENPYMNYEYMLLDIARNYNVGYLKINNIVWAEVDTRKQYERALKKIYPIMKRKEAAYRENQIIEYLVSAFNIGKESIQEIQPFGGMTNKNYKVLIDGQEYVLRISGIGTEKMINRWEEKYNAQIASTLGIDADLLYFNEQNGIKISRLIPEAETLNTKTAKREDNMIMTTNVLKQLHQSNQAMASTFNVFNKITEYEMLLAEFNGSTYPGYDQIKKQVMQLKELYMDMDVVLVPCHNDTVPENFVKSGEQKIYLIDWEYAGMNDPMWDIAAHSLECEFSEEDEELFLSYYLEQSEIPHDIKIRILMNKIFQDFLWTIWTNIKEAKGENFGAYGLERFHRAKENLSILMSKEKKYALSK
ncbi:NTP transferase domain-containing protein [Bacillus sp. T33-2]|uniref:NTP transferase domain-containing protein n=1 Tax=Bacillus sp. T33-2 TaxID=2054168 RepID=UPI000C77C673|nr:NTP transferase domain-containing protein [Bacillus sp. T33-2]PLR90773.1 LPS biosynthesis choline kinase [Bacillus sp. T33-2]